MSEFRKILHGRVGLIFLNDELCVRVLRSNFKVIAPPLFWIVGIPFGRMREFQLPPS